MTAKKHTQTDAETFPQFAPRLETYLFRWLELRGKVRAFEDLVDLFQEQLIYMYSMSAFDRCRPSSGEVDK